MGEKLSEAQRRVLEAIKDTSNALREDDECSPPWWIEAGPTVRASVARSLVRRGLVYWTGRLGGLPGTLTYTITPAGRSALAREEG